LPIALALGAIFAVACQSSGRDSRPWRASDHDRGDAPPGEIAPSAPAVPEQQALAPTPTTSSPHMRDDSREARVMQSWVSRCMRCHGQIGAGDGPDGVATGARNLSDESWQSAVSDRRIADAIQKGRGRMPPSTVEPDILDGLVQLVRRMGAHSGPMPGAAPEGPPAP
jgi:hypothetical protein